MSADAIVNRYKKIPDRSCSNQRNSDLFELRHLVVRNSGKPEVRCHPRLSSLQNQTWMAEQVRP